MTNFARRAFSGAKERYHGLSIGRRMALLYFLAALVPLIITNLYANSTLNSNARSTQMTAAERGFEQTAAVLSDQFRRILRACDVVALDQTLNDCLYLHTPEELSLTAQIADMNTIRAFLSQKQDDLDIHGIRLYVLDGWIYSQRADMLSSLTSASRQPWYALLMQENHQAVFCPPQTLAEEGILSCARRVRNLENLNIVEAVLRIDFPLAEIEQILRQGCVIEGSVSMLLTGQGAPVAASGDIPAGVDLVQLVLTAGVSRGFEVLDDNHFAQCIPLSGSDWYLVTLLSRDAIARANIMAWLGVIFLILAASLPTMLLAHRVLGDMTGRLRGLSDHMQNVRLGELTPTERDENRDEIGTMTDSYNYMIERMETLLDEQYRTGQEARSAELLALQSQINPHFLYNTLDMLLWMARRQQTQEIQTVIKALANFYRASLSGGRDIVTLRDELRLIESYMTIQHHRFGDDVTLKIDVDEEILPCLLPKITLQPIVENALLHGILPREDKRGTITIRGRRRGENVVIEIEDDGIGISQDRLETMLYPANPEKAGGGYGLYNIEKRLCLTFGVARCVFIDGLPGGGTRVRITFPLTPTPEHVV